MSEESKKPVYSVKINGGGQVFELKPWNPDVTINQKKTFTLHDPKAICPIGSFVTRGEDGKIVGNVSGRDGNMAVLTIHDAETIATLLQEPQPLSMSGKVDRG